MGRSPRWRPELAAELAAHRQVGMRAEPLGPQVAGLLCDVAHYLDAEPRMLAYAQRILSEAQTAIPYARQAPLGYAPTRGQLGRRGLAADTWPLDVLTTRWRDGAVASLTVVVWVVRRYVRLHAQRHGARGSPWAADFVGGTHAPRVEAMQRTLLGTRPPERRHVRPWRPHHA